ncbi:MAG: Mobile element protein [uncultured Chloroflexia bacterium]|uniref:Mobile element protein n=1 Tax=uncultured Chloroflexia bacterium TaxID=1672391 RepID=A0A6J4I3Z0_9CHLR|nr:MAG: Mobile element protein [uncultured Chloroflexia bacterium]
MSPPQLVVGVDIAAASFMAAWARPGHAPSTPQPFDQTPAGFASFQKQLATAGVAPDATLVVLEATGSYWVALAVELHSAGYRVAVANPAHVHNYAKSLPRRGKTDGLDARLLTQFGLERQLASWTPPPAVYHELRQRLVARDGLLTMRQQARNQLHALEQWPVRVAAVQQQMTAVIASLDEQVRTLEQAITAVLADGAWAASAAHLQSIPGLGMVTAAWLLVGTVNFTTCASAQAAANSAGLVPLERQSGTSIRGRPSIGHGGNGRVRTALYMATLSAARYNPVIKTFYTRLREAGKPAKVARCAAARKLLHLAFAVVTKAQDFDPSYQKTPVVSLG